MKDQARISRERPAQIFSAHVAQASDSVKADFGKLETVKRIIRNVQRGVLPKDPATLQELTINGEWSQTSREEPFLIHDSGPDSHNTVIVFASEIGLRHLEMLQAIVTKCEELGFSPKMFTWTLR